jgi:hypothetical protein
MKWNSLDLYMWLKNLQSNDYNYFWKCLEKNKYYNIKNNWTILQNDWKKRIQVAVKINNKTKIYSKVRPYLQVPRRWPIIRSKKDESSISVYCNWWTIYAAPTTTTKKKCYIYMLNTLISYTLLYTDNNHEPMITILVKISQLTLQH